MASTKTCVKAFSMGEKATVEQVSAALTEIMGGTASPGQIGAFLLGLGTVGQASDPVIITACAKVMVDFAVPCTHGHPTPEPQVTVDIVGTGGDGMDTFNVSTASGIVMAACGITVAKHGNRSSSGKVGSADFLETLGARIDLDAKRTAQVIEACGFGFLFAQKFHPAMKNVAPIRKQLGVPTVFNVLGPLTNPAAPDRQVTGVGKRALGPIFAEILRRQGKRGLIAHSTDGLDEISPCAPTDVWEVSGSPLQIKEYQISPADFGLEPCALEDVSGGSAEERVEWFREAISGKKGPIRDFIIINAAAGLYVGEVAADFKTAAAIVANVLDSGKVQNVLDKYVRATLEVAPPLAIPAKAESQVVKVESTYCTPGGVTVTRTRVPVDGNVAIEELVDALDTQRGVLMTSSYEYPGRYTMWDRGFVNPPVAVTAQGSSFSVTALNARGNVLVPAIHASLSGLDAIEKLGHCTETKLISFSGTTKVSASRFPEEQRSRQPSVFSVVRAIIGSFFEDSEGICGLYGAFSYDLAFQFEKVKMKHERPTDQRDIVLYIPDSVVTTNADKSQCFRYDFEFSFNNSSTAGLPRDGAQFKFEGATSVERVGDHKPGEYADKVRTAREKFHKGDLFEAVLSQTFYRPCPAPPSELFRRLRKRNPAPYCFIISLGDDEWLVGASPEMYVRVQGDRVETCPISGTIARGQDAVADASQILELLNSKKEESELTMCTDVDRNDKSRICEPGSVKVIARRQIEKYSRLIHTVDHVEGKLRPEFDALDAFLCHTWAVTVTGAPKVWAMQFVEDQEESCRAWYAGAIGGLHFDRSMDTGLTLRTIRIKGGVASVRAGATLLWDSDPDAEEQETRLKASAFLDALSQAPAPTPAPTTPVGSPVRPKPERGGLISYKVLVIDHEDSFVHTLANYVAQCGAEVSTVRAGLTIEEVESYAPDMVLMSPGPGCPDDFGAPAMIGALAERGIPVFGVCLGLQSIVQHFGGKLDILPTPVHGKPHAVRVNKSVKSYLLEGLPEEFVAARYHSIYAQVETFPECLEVVAETAEKIIMAIQHKKLPIAAVQFHPESILTAHEHGIRIINNAIEHFRTMKK